MSSELHPWHHRPAHIFMPNAFYMVTAGALHKAPVFNGTDRLTLLMHGLFEAADGYGWQLQAWAVFSNHDHFIAHAPADVHNLREMIRRLHSQTSRQVNVLDGQPGRKVWFQYWDTCLTYERSYLARLNYVHHNPVKHGLVHSADRYPYCSASWFAEQAEPAFRREVESFAHDRVNVPDDF